VGPADNATCSKIANKEKIDCAANDLKWTIPGCLAKGCCHIEVPGYPACFMSHAHMHLAKCEVSDSARKDCGNATTTEMSCVAKGCCWELTTGAPNCFYPKDGVIETSTKSSITDNPTVNTPDKTTSSQNPITSGPTIKPSDAGKCDVAVSWRQNCLHGSESNCIAADCCWQIATGAPYCYHHRRSSGINSTKVYIHVMLWFETKATNGGQ
jgi:hypothetical protein